MRIFNNEQMRLIDENAKDAYKIPGILLMEHAGIKVYEEVYKMIKDQENQKVIVVCGVGNNGGDGFVVAKHLYHNHIPVEVFVIGKIEHMSKDAKVHFDILKAFKVPVYPLESSKNMACFLEKIKMCKIIVDAIFGTGLSRPIQGSLKNIIEMMNQSDKTILSIDIPSGISGNDANVYGVSVRASKTVTLVRPKIGNILYPGAYYGGELVVKDIGIPISCIEEIPTKTYLITQRMIQEILPKRKPNTHKGSYGKAYMIAGSMGMSGANILSAKACLKSGVGLLKMPVPKSINTIIESSLIEAITIPLTDEKKERVSVLDIGKILKNMENSNVVAIGPGSGKGKELEELLRNVLENVKVPVVLDADALNVLANRLDLLELVQTPVVITPHIGEMARLTGQSITKIEQNPMQVAKEFAQKWNIVVVLKGARTIIAEPKGKVFINQTGNPGMATAGSGDVLTGIITSFIAQGIHPLCGAMSGVYIHGKAGDLAAEELGEYGVVASDILKSIPLAIKNVVGK